MRGYLVRVGESEGGKGGEGNEVDKKSENLLKDSRVRSILLLLLPLVVSEGIRYCDRSSMHQVSNLATRARGRECQTEIRSDSNNATRG